MSFFRSEPMVFCRIILHQEHAFDCLVQLGYLGKVHFVHIYDSDSTANNKFSNQIERCSAALRIIKRLQDGINNVGMHTVFYKDADEIVPQESDLPAIERTLQRLDDELTEVQSNCEGLQSQRFTLYEHREVLERVERIINKNNDWQSNSYDSLLRNLLRSSSLSYDDVMTRLEDTTKPAANETGFFLVTGSIPVKRFPAFELMIWRLARGNVVVSREEFTLPDELAERFQQRNLKYAFMLAFIGENLRQKIMKVCQGFNIKLYSCANTTADRQRDLLTIERELNYLKQILEQSCTHRKRILSAASSELFNWRAIMRKMHQVYYVMNHFSNVDEERQESDKYLQADCWIPRCDMLAVRKALRHGSRIAAGGMLTLTFPPLLIERQHNNNENLMPPTYFQTNKFTQGFQNLINAYGIASYREANPTPYTIVTFPFLFAVMFGDIGHGIIMALFAFVLIFREKKIKRQQIDSLDSSEIFDMLFAGRYVILLMGLFSIYTGFIYNEMFSKPMNLFGSSWLPPNKTAYEESTDLNPSDPEQYRGTPYVFGLDPIWNSLSVNGIILNNSLKMKIAIILGVFQMLFGLALSGWNALFFRNRMDFLLVFLPQIVFLTSLFLYLVFLIFHKWLYYGGHEVGAYSANCGPSILITFINMILVKTADEPPAGCSSTMFEGQIQLQYFLLVVALISVPVLLCGKPIHLMYKHKRIAAIQDPEYQAEYRNSTMNSIRRSLIYNIKFMESDPHLSRRHEEEENLSEIWIHQGIHTIECVLGSVSHTASYLRLWALSLAHSQLSEVLWRMILSRGLTTTHGFFNSIVIFCTFSAFAVLTVAILVVMEGLSAFLHTLRLHWVEFQSKFYGGLGEVFSPFLFQESRRKDSYA